MAGRKTPSEPNFFNTLLGKLGLGETPPAPQPAKKGKRRRKRVEGASPEGFAGGAGSGLDAEDGPSPFAEYGAQGGLMDGQDDFAEALNYEAAAAAGYAPPAAAPATAPAASSAAPAARPAAPAPLPQRPEDGKLFSSDALDNSLDALFSGLETGLADPPLPPLDAPPAPAPAAAEKPLFDEFGLTPAAPVEAPEPPPAPPAPLPAPAPRTIHKPIVTDLPAPVMPPEPPAPLPTAPVPAPAAASSLSGLPYAAHPDQPLALAEGVDFNQLFAAIGRVSGVAGSILVGWDGLLIASQLPDDQDPDFLGALACNLFTSNGGQLAKMGRPELRRIVLETASGAMLLSSADMGILVVVSHEGRPMDIGGVMGAIGGVVGRGRP